MALALNALVPADGAGFGVDSAEEGSAVAAALCALGLKASSSAMYRQVEGGLQCVHVVSLNK